MLLWLIAACLYKNVASLGCAIRALQRTELILSVEQKCRSGVTHMPYLAGSVWMCINSAALDLDRPLEKLKQ